MARVPNPFLWNLVQSINVDDHNGVESKSRTKLNVYANIVVMDWNALIINDNRQSTVIITFVPEHESLKEIPTIDAAVKYECQSSVKASSLC